MNVCFSNKQLKKCCLYCICFTGEQRKIVFAVFYTLSCSLNLFCYSRKRRSSENCQDDRKVGDWTDVETRVRDSYTSVYTCISILITFCNAVQKVYNIITWLFIFILHILYYIAVLNIIVCSTYSFFPLFSVLWLLRWGLARTWDLVISTTDIQSKLFFESYLLLAFSPTIERKLYLAWN